MWGKLIFSFCGYIVHKVWFVFYLKKEDDYVFIYQPTLIFYIYKSEKFWVYTSTSDLWICF